MSPLFALHRLISFRPHPRAPESCDCVDSILVLGRMATLALRLCHPFLTFAALRGVWPSPNFCYQCPPTALNSSMAVGDLLQTYSHKPQGHQIPSNLCKRALRADHITTSEWRLPGWAQGRSRPQFLHKHSTGLDFASKGYASIRQACNIT